MDVNILNPSSGRGGVNLTPPPRFFRKSPKTGGNLDQQKNISEPNSFPEILKKIACNLVQPFSHRNYAVNMGRGGGGQITPPPLHEDGLT